MSIDLLLYILDLHLLQIKLHLLAILYALISNPSQNGLSTIEHLLNFNVRLAGCAAAFRPSILMSMAIRERALGGRRARKFRAVLPDRPLKGEKLARTDVTYFASMLTSATAVKLTPQGKVSDVLVFET